jgi:hypothetical protein
MRGILVVCVASAVGAACGRAGAQPIPVSNWNFELPVLNPDGYSIANVPGWSLVSGSPGGDWGVFYPTAGVWGYSSPEGHQQLYTNGPTIEQVLGVNVQGGQSYQLRVDVIHRPIYGAQNYFVELWGGATLLARDNNTLSPPSGGFLVSTLNVTVPVNSPAVGQALKIRLGGLNQTNFDEVRLTAGVVVCYANCDHSTTAPVLNVLDFNCFLNAFSSGNPYANCDGSTTAPVLNVLDFNCFLNRFSAGCP